MKKDKQSLKQQMAEYAFCLIQFITIIVAVTSGYYWHIQYAFAVLLWFLHNAVSYHKGKYEICIDEYEEDGYPDLGLKNMVKSWVWTIPCSFIAMLIMTNLEIEFCLMIFSIYAVFLLISNVGDK